MLLVGRKLETSFSGECIHVYLIDASIYTELCMSACRNQFTVPMNDIRTSMDEWL